jgi:hypothetical protein
MERITQIAPVSGMCPLPLDYEQLPIFASELACFFSSSK